MIKVYHVPVVDARDDCAIELPIGYILLDAEYLGGNLYQFIICFNEKEELTESFSYLFTDKLLKDELPYKEFIFRSKTMFLYR